MTWDHTTYRRSLIDCHIPDWDPVFLSTFDADDYVYRIKRAGQQAVMHYANSHSGQCMWDTNVGPRHRNMADRDFFREVESACRMHDLPLRVYYSIIFDSWNYEHHEDWRMVPKGNVGEYQKGRYGNCCPNSPGYRDYIRACMEELVGNYDVVDVFFDMLFWPIICYCGNCQKRYLSEERDMLPVEADWDDLRWRSFYSARKRWLTEFAFWCRESVKRINSKVTVGFNNATFFSGWPTAVPFEVGEAGDYLFGDFYGGPTQHAMACKLYHSLRPHRPYEYATFVTEHPGEHALAKSEDQICTDIGLALIHHGAMMQIDAFNIDGTLNPKVYERLNRLNAERPIYEKYLGGHLTADVAVFVDKDSFYNPNGPGWRQGPHHSGLMGAAQALQEEHIPFAVVTNANIEDLSRHRAVIAAGVLELTEEQAEALRQFVYDGGVLYASGMTSLDRSASPAPRYFLEDVFGVRHRGRFPHRVNYLSLEDDALLETLYPQHCLTVTMPVEKTELLPGARCLAKVRPTFVDPDAGRMIGQTFASIHSNPPAVEATESPALVINQFGKGACVWSAAAFEAGGHWSSRALLTHLIRRVLPEPYHFEAKAPSSTEVTLFSQPDKNRLVVGLLHRDTMPCAVGASLRVRLPEDAQDPRHVILLPSEREIDFTVIDACVEFTVPPFQVVNMAVLEYD